MSSRTVRSRGAHPSVQISEIAAEIGRSRSDIFPLLDLVHVSPDRLVEIAASLLKFVQGFHQILMGSYRRVLFQQRQRPASAESR